MWVKALYLKNFRNYKERLFTFAPGINCIIGENGEGKTNLLEALHFLLFGRSFRTLHLTDLLQFGASTFYLEALFEKEGIEQTLKITCDGHKRVIYLDQTPLLQVSALFDVLTGITLSPTDYELIKGGPKGRRSFLDLHCAQNDLHYLAHLSRYQRAMQQRNSQLRQRDFRSIEIWEKEMAVSGAYLIEVRLEACQRLEIEGRALQQQLAPGDSPFALRYQQGGSAKERSSSFFEQVYVRERERDSHYGYTHIGPHRDDLLIILGDHLARSFASMGQQRSCIMFLKLAQWMRRKQLSHSLPLCCIDDVDLSLDVSRQKRLLDHLKNMGQVFLTSPELLPLEEAHVLHIEREKTADREHCLSSQNAP